MRARYCEADGLPPCCHAKIEVVSAPAPPGTPASACAASLCLRRRQHGASEPGNVNPCVLALVIHHARVVFLRDVRHPCESTLAATLRLRQQHRAEVDADVAYRAWRSTSSPVAAKEPELSRMVGLASRMRRLRLLR